MVAMASNLHPEVSSFLSGGPKKLLIGGQWVDAASGKTFETINPATGDVLARVAEGDQEDVNRAVAAARKAFDEGPWPGMTPAERSRMIWKIADLIEEHADAFAQLETLDNGKPITAARRDDVGGTIDYFRYYAGWPTKIQGHTVPVSMPDVFGYTLRQPVGVCAQIIPWNYPLMMAAWKLAPALAAGCTMVLKPAEQTPLSALLLGQLILEAGVPAGVVNVVTGFGETAGAALAAHMDVDKIAFTGSVDVGKLIMQAAGKSNLKKISLELGGKSPNIVFADADMDAAREGAAAGIFYNMGQDCTAGSRVFVEQRVYDDVAEYMAAHSKSLKIGHGLDESTDIGPLVSNEQIERVTGYLQLGRQEGARVLSGGERVTEGELARGFFVRPTVFAGARNDMRIAQEEIFGPTTAIIPVGDLDEAIRVSNGIKYGLSSSIFTQDVNAAFRAMRDLEAGITYVNAGTIGAEVHLPFGGTKDTGNGHREAGQAALDVYTEWKSIYVDYSGHLQRAQIDVE